METGIEYQTRLKYEQYMYFHLINIYEYYRWNIWQGLSICEPTLASDDLINLDAFCHELYKWFYEASHRRVGILDINGINVKQPNETSHWKPFRCAILNRM